MALPISRLQGACRAFFSDLDGTLTTGGRVEARTWAALEKLDAAGVPIIIVTGRPAGWGQAIMAIAPAAAAVTENGGVTFVRRGARLEKIYGVPADALPDWRRRMRAAADAVFDEVPGAQLSTDSAYREVDLAIDWNEEVSLSPAQADRVVEMLIERGFTAARSSVHVNFSPPGFNKLTACKPLVSSLLGGDEDDLSPYVFVGDSLNDAPMFGGFPRSVGVANVRDWWDRLAHKPAFVADSREAEGLRAVIDHLLEG